jgi:hypothetical protein
MKKCFQSIKGIKGNYTGSGGRPRAGCGGSDSFGQGKFSLIERGFSGALREQLLLQAISRNPAVMISLASRF